MDSIGNDVIKNPALFNWLAQRMNYWKGIKPGRYKIDKGQSIISIVRMLRNDRQAEINLTINKLRTKEDLAKMTGTRFEFDSLAMQQFLDSDDSVRTYGLQAEIAMCAVLPDTYTFFWNTTPRKVFDKLKAESERFWTDERKKKAEARGLEPYEAYILASIIEEETNKASDKPNMASVYLNRIEKNMRLQADPTVKFALRDFSLKRIYQKHTQTISPYNTYQVHGLPPGPICTPSKLTIDAVLNSPKTEYLYFVANSDLSGTHVFSTNYDDHLRLAREYQQVLNKLELERKARQAPQ
jgi:UPF0755 protein